MTPQADSQLSRGGTLYALAAFGFWGLVPIYYKQIQQVPAIEVLAHRVAWTVAMGAILLTLRGSWGGLRPVVAQGRLLRTLVASSLLISVNWLVFIYAVQTGRVLETSLGYYINPLVNVLLGMSFLGERLNRARLLAVLLAAAGTVNLAVAHGSLPWISLVLAFSFGFYGLVRKRAPVPVLGGLFLETLFAFPLAACGLLWLGLRGEGAFLAGSWSTDLLLMLAGPVTMLPLLWFTQAARRLPLTVVGLFQYLAPSITFLLAVLVYHESFTVAHLVTFALIWAGLAVFTADGLATYRRLRARTGLTPDRGEPSG